MNLFFTLPLPGESHQVSGTTGAAVTGSKARQGDVRTGQRANCLAPGAFK